MRPLFIAALSALAAFAGDVKYDDDAPDGNESQSEMGYAVWFEGPVRAKSVKIHAARGKAAAFDVIAYDRDANVLAEAAFDGDKLPEKAGWARLSLPVDSEAGALVVVYFNEGEEGAISWDKDGEQHSTLYLGGQHQPFQQGNWMVRLSTEAGEPPMEFAKAKLPQDKVKRADSQDAFEVRMSDAGHAVRFEADAGQNVAGVSFFGRRTGRLTKRFQVSICDESLRPFLTKAFRYGDVGRDEKWQSLELRLFPTRLSGPFWVVFDFQCDSANWIAMGACRAVDPHSAEALPGSVFRRAPPGETWMVRAHLEEKEGQPAIFGPPDADFDTVLTEISKKFFKGRERCDKVRLLSILAPDAPGFEALQGREDDPTIGLGGEPHREFVRELARFAGKDRATVVFATLAGPFLWDPPDELRAARAKRRPFAPGVNLFRNDGPGRHQSPHLAALSLVKTDDGWKLRSWDEFDLRDAAFGVGLLENAPKLDDVLKSLIEARSAGVASIAEEINGMEAGDDKNRLLAELAAVWAEEGDVVKWAAIAKALPETGAAMLRQTLFVEGKHFIAAGADEAVLRRALDVADPLWEGMQKRFGLAPEGLGRPRILVQTSDQSSWVAHPAQFPYAELVWFASEDDLKRPPSIPDVALALADACAGFHDDANQTRRWLAAGAIASADLSGGDTPAKLRESVASVPAGRDTVEGNLKIVSEASRLFGDPALGAALTSARNDGARRSSRHGRVLYFDELAKALATGTGKKAEVMELFKR